MESQSCAYENTLHGLEVYLGIKRKLHECHDDDMKSVLQFLNFPNLNCSLNSKRSKLIAQRSVNSLSKCFACMTMIDGALQATREKYKQHKIKCAATMPSCPEIPLLENLAGNHILTAPAHPILACPFTVQRVADVEARIYSREATATAPQHVQEGSPTLSERVRLQHLAFPQESRLR
ncbi:hypothetical protein V6N11_026414 [Hibiscus sabdariffa]|uniref:Uncharacterized protein n=1 Tax=Hibiscus sabdariffa TaxID=183260 RepID=A0ABR2SVM0_9ROSI